MDTTLLNKRRVARIVKIEILTTPDCVHCAEAKRVINKIKKDTPNVKVETIDVTEHPDVAQKYMLMTAPGIVIDGKLEFIGVPKEEELRKKLFSK